MVDSDLAIGRELTKLEVRLHDRRGTELLQQRELALDVVAGPAQFGLPLSYSLTPASGAADFRLVMTGRGPLGASGEEIEVVEQQAIATFRAHSRLLLPVFLGRSCLHQLCRSPEGQRTDLTCDVQSGACLPVPERELTSAGSGPLGEVDAGMVGVSSGAASDAGALSAPTPVSPSASEATGATAADRGVAMVPTTMAPAAPPPPKPACDVALDVDVPCSLMEAGSPIVWPSGMPVGSCRAGKRSCVAGAWGVCTGAVLPAERDTCEPGNDADCDGTPNEGCPCVNGTSRACGSSVGRCRPGVQTCAGGVWSDACEGALAAQARDSCEPGDDSSCNGVPNEGCECVSGATSSCGQALPGSAACAETPITCANGSWPRAACATACDRCPAGACGGGRCVTRGASWSCVCNEGFEGTGTQQCTRSCPMWYRDCDGDGYAASAMGAVRSCSAPPAIGGCAAWTSRAPDPGAVDCDDANTGYHPDRDFAVLMPFDPRTATPTGYSTLCLAPGDGSGAALASYCVIGTNPDLNCDGRVELRRDTTYPVCTPEKDCGCVPEVGSCGILYSYPIKLCEAPTTYPTTLFTYCR